MFVEYKKTVHVLVTLTTRVDERKRYIRSKYEWTN